MLLSLFCKEASHQGTNCPLAVFSSECIGHQLQSRSLTPLLCPTVAAAASPPPSPPSPPHAFTPPLLGPTSFYFPYPHLPRPQLRPARMFFETFLPPFADGPCLSRSAFPVAAATAHSRSLWCPFSPVPPLPNAGRCSGYCGKFQG